MDSAHGEGAELQRLVDAARRGEADARQRLITQHLPGLRAFVRLKMRPTLRQMESCSDVVQSVCREVVADLDRFEYRGAASFRNWLFRSALNKIIDKQRYWNADRRDPGREVRPADDERSLLESYATFTTPSQVAMGHEGLERIEAAFDRLPERHREVILLSRIIGLPHREIAMRMDSTEEATRALLRRALVRLSGILDSDET